MTTKNQPFDKSYREWDFEPDASEAIKISLLDVGTEEYGDAVLCQFGDVTVLIDGAHPGNYKKDGNHPSIPDQIGKLLNRPEPPYEISLLIVSHAHLDHIGCLPRLVRDDTVRFKWALVTDPQLGWGRAQNEDRDGSISDDKVRKLVAALHEEIRTDRTDDEGLAQFLTDAQTLEEMYVTMLDTLAERGTRVIRHGRNSTQGLINEFGSVGMRIIGPSQQHLLECADIINRTTHDSIGRVTDFFQGDATENTVRAYRQLTSQNLDALDVSRPGPAVNLQSTVITFNFQGHKFLFAGDMQFEDPQVSNTFLKQSVKRLRQKIKAAAPFSFVKLSHHGSFNAFSEEILGELGDTKIFGICAGEQSKHHPNRSVLEVLDDHRQEIKWARTDHNGLVTLTFGPGQPQIKLSAGQINDPQPNSEDTVIPTGLTEKPTTAMTLGRPSEMTTQPPAVKSTPVESTAASMPDVVEIHAKIPHTSTRVTITVDVEPRASSRQDATTGPPSLSRAPVEIASGRGLPELLFVTSKQSLAANIGATEADQLLDSIRARNLPLYDAMPGPGQTATDAFEIVRQQLSQHPGAQGVVLVGGYDVIPAQIIDCLPRDLRQSLPPNEDPDGFVVWSDDIYGLRGADGLPRLPVSRIPDGKSAQLVFGAIQAKSGSFDERRYGVRNVARPFAQSIYDSLPGRSNMLVSKPATHNQNDPAIKLDADQVYFMLHGDYVDSTRFWGEGTAQGKEAININNVPAQAGRVVFAGCCWGGLIVDTPAGLVEANRPFGPKTAESSIALKFLSRGANAFVGCTGAHYSPTDPPFKYYGGPMHEAFWRAFNSGASPAKALLDAKSEYAKAIPHGKNGALSKAIEYKILHQYTCLGLGW